MRFMKSIYALFIVVFLSSCLFGVQTQNMDESISNKAIVSFHKTRCFKDVCPSYKLYLMDDGNLVLEAFSNIGREGTYCIAISELDKNKIIEAFIASDFFSFQDEYNGNITDVPTTYISFRYAGDYKKIKDVYGAPDALKSLESMMETYINRNGWIKCNK